MTLAVRINKGACNHLNKKKMLDRDKVFGLFFISLVLVVSVLAATDICDQNCELNTEKCTDSTRPFLCERSFWPDKCVPKGYDFGACGGKTDGGGYCSECDEGCIYLGDGCSGDTPYSCRKSWAADKCVAKGYDFGCCGGLEPGDNHQMVLNTYITNNDPECADDGHTVKWEIKHRGEANFVDYSDKCIEKNYKDELINIGLGESIGPLTCRSKFIPWKDTGPHTARVSWCTYSNETVYGAPPSSGKYCVVNISADGDNEREIGFDNIVKTLEDRINDIVNGKRGAATISAYDPVWKFYWVSGLESSYVPAEDIEHVRKCLAGCPDCAVVMNLKEDVHGSNVKRDGICTARAGATGAYTGAIFLSAAAVSGGGLSTGDGGLTVDEEIRKEYGVELPKELGDEFRDKGYLVGDKFKDRLRHDTVAVAEKYDDIFEAPGYKTLSDLYYDFDREFVSMEVSDKIVDAIKSDSNFNSIRESFIDELMNYKINTDAGFTNSLQSAMKSKYLTRQPLTRPEAEKIVDFFFNGDDLGNKGLVYSSKFDPNDIDVFNEVLASKVKIIREGGDYTSYKTLKEFIEGVYGGATSDYAVFNTVLDAKGGYWGPHQVQLNIAYLSEYISTLAHENGHHIDYHKIGILREVQSLSPAMQGNVLEDKNCLSVIELASTKTQYDVLEALNNRYPGAGFDVISIKRRLINYQKRKVIGPYSVGIETYNYFKNEKGIDLLTSNVDDLKEIVTKKNTLMKSTAKILGIVGDITKALKDGGEALATKLGFDKKKGVYIAVGKGMKGAKITLKIVNKATNKVLFPLDMPLGGLWGIYETEKNPLLKKRVEIETRSGNVGDGLCGETCDTECGSMIISRDEEGVYRLVDDFTIERGYLWDIYIGSEDADIVHKAVCEELRMEGKGIDLTPHYMECTPVDGEEYMNCVEKDKVLAVTDSGELFPSDGDTGYLKAGALEEE
ncbi:MAG: hypothetical protein B6U72_03100 [Candidatus Altiarchaeales archaeon ex4484_2]|nr:MAG: hypothetical protein B6U72_03100 [Candidatus Altiarchaeales archaeon ex4484_2]